LEANRKINAEVAEWGAQRPLRVGRQDVVVESFAQTARSG
jgi:hypothetical protein